ncbi:hypothetical protein DUNSADRAFT_1145 [Dunaliella salina]|uniref:Encoded protein n=1 Tax=Dunaliella salina TaxID=3046 RepID=A0ABQ7FXW5_DUNSA|nr:hypothetical protein DUNSADRAFT_1145 [Dunaliella salina]|eukprot:KAF5827207.1 hypothetical protein DUNSADRAFT_1145 [Dunaliella salina]
MCDSALTSSIHLTPHAPQAKQAQESTSNSLAHPVHRLLPLTAPHSSGLTFERESYSTSHDASKRDEGFKWGTRVTPCQVSRQDKTHTRGSSPRVAMAPLSDVHHQYDQLTN